jgi:hypothetical protein
VSVREKGVDQLNVEKCTAFLQFCSDPKEGFLDVVHTLNGSILKVREFTSNDTEKILDDWGADELKENSKRARSHSESPPRKYQQNDNRGRSEVRYKSAYRDQSRLRMRSRSLSSESSSNKLRKTRTIAVVLMFQKWTEESLEGYFSQYGEIDEFKAPRNGRKLYIKYKEYTGAVKALQIREHIVKGEKYFIQPAADY